MLALLSFTLYAKDAKYNLSISKSEPVTLVNSLGRMIVSFTTGSTSTNRKACIDD
jgi:hypothetical protein|nr:MAG TPA: hypothetical protein [Bacteriophage sp.]